MRFKRTTVTVAGIVACVGIASIASVSAALPTAPSAVNLPPRFEANEGQHRGDVRFVGRDFGSTVLFTDEGAEIQLRPAASKPKAEVDGSSRVDDGVGRVKLTFVGANLKPEVVGEAPLATQTHYFLGKDQKAWHTNVASYARLRYRNVYPGIDVVYYSNAGQLEYDLEVAPGADISKVKLAFEGGAPSRPDADGSIVIDTPAGILRSGKPDAYQVTNGRRLAIASSYNFWQMRRRTPRHGPMSPPAATR